MNHDGTYVERSPQQPPAPPPAGPPSAAHPSADVASGAPAAEEVPVVVLSGRPEVAQLVHSVAGPGTRIGLHRWADDRQPVPAGQLAAELAAADAGVVCIGDDVPLHHAFEVSAAIDRAYAHIAVILLAIPWPEVWRDAARAGVRDVVDPQAAATELPPSLARAVDRAAQFRRLRAGVAAPEAPTSRVIVVLSPKGGSGKTMVSANLTAALAGAAPGPVVLVDLDVQFGDAATALGLTPEHTLGQLALSPEIELTALKVFLTRHEPSGAYVLCGAASPDEGEAVTHQQAAHIVDLLCQDFACVVVDTPAGLDDRTLTVLERATDLVLVATLDVSSIRNLAKEIDALDRLGMTGATRHFVLNRADARVGIEPADVEAALGITFDASVPSSRSIPYSMNQGRPLVLDDPAAPASRELSQLAGRFVGGGHERNGHHEERAPVDPRAWFRRLRR